MRVLKYILSSTSFCQIFILNYEILQSVSTLYKILNKSWIVSLVSHNRKKPFGIVFNYIYIYVFSYILFDMYFWYNILILFALISYLK